MNLACRWKPKDLIALKEFEKEKAAYFQQVA